MPDSPSSPPAPDDDLDPNLAIRRHTDRCFHRVEEVVPEGYIVEGILIPREEVAEVRPADEACPREERRT
ncbi:MAG: hypothetical protein NTW19_13955 [Planctomycetota bacterium]|nr:hypothetical protein [Planctomycetota bacterium]